MRMMKIFFIFYRQEKPKLTPRNQRKPLNNDLKNNYRLANWTARMGRGFPGWRFPEWRFASLRFFPGVSDAPFWFLQAVQHNPGLATAPLPFGMIPFSTMLITARRAAARFKDRISTTRDGDFPGPPAWHDFSRTRRKIQPERHILPGRKLKTRRGKNQNPGGGFSRGLDSPRRR